MCDEQRNDAQGELAPLLAEEDGNVSSPVCGNGIEGEMGRGGLKVRAPKGRGCRAGSASRNAALSALGAAPSWAATGQEMERPRHRGGEDAMDSRSQRAKDSGLLTTMAIGWWWWSGDGFESESCSSRSRTQTSTGPRAWSCSAGQAQPAMDSGRARGGCWEERGQGQRAMRSQEVGNGVPGGSGWVDGLRGAIRVRLCAEEEDGEESQEFCVEGEKAKLGLIWAVV